MKQATHPLAAIAAAILAVFALSGCEVRSTTPAAAPAAQGTGKERLSDKASDEQRVDNCNVPPDRRGTRPRPGCMRNVGR